MKRAMNLLVSLLMCFSALTISVHAQEFEVIPEQHMTYINPLYADSVSKDDLVQPYDGIALLDDEPAEYLVTEDAAKYFREQMVNREETITVYWQGTDSYKSAASEIPDQAEEHTGIPGEGDNLKWQYAGWKCDMSGYSSGGVYYITFTYTVTYYTTAAQEAELDAAVDNMLASLDTGSGSDYEKISAVYEYITDHVVYDYDNLDDDSYKLKYTAYAALVNGTSVCQGYANLLYRCALELGIDCRIISGTGNGDAHSWNIIKLGDYYYNADATWDAGSVQAGNDYDYFLRAEENFADHTRNEEYLTSAFTEVYVMDTEDYVYTPEPGPAASGTCGDALTWQMYDSGLLKISGTGMMTDYDYGEAPWSQYNEIITQVVIEDGAESIGSCAFYDCGSLSGITIPDSVKEIGMSAFNSCAGLTSIALPEQLETIGELAFSYCSVLEEVTLGDHITSIGSAAFFECDSLAEITIPESVTAIEQIAFAGCDSLAKIEVSENNPVYSSDEGILYNKAQTELIACPAGKDEITGFPETLTAIGQCAFWQCTNFAGITLPEGVTAIGTYAFSCSSLEEITLPHSLHTIEEAAFLDCDDLADIYYYGTEEEWNAVEKGEDNDVLKEAVMHYLPVIEPVSITEQPSSVTCISGETASFSVTAEGTDLSYQWYCRTSADGEWEAVEGNDAVLILNADMSMDGYEYMCTVTSGNGTSADTDIVTLTVVLPSETAIIEDPSDVTTIEYNTVSFNVEAEGTGLTYQWYYRTSSTGKWRKTSASGNTTDTITLTVKTKNDGYQYRCEITDSTGKKLTSEAATLKVEKAITVTKNPKGTTVLLSGETAELHIEAEGNGVEIAGYKWYYRTSSEGTWHETTLTGWNTDTLTVEGKLSRDGYEYRCKVIAENGAYQYTYGGVLRVSDLKITENPTDVTVTAGDTAVFHAEGTASGSVTYQWYYRSPSMTNFAKTSASGNTTDTLTVTTKAKNNGYQYRCVITDEKGASVTTEAATLTVK